MTPDELRRRFEGLRVWSRQGRRAPHKPLLALWAIGRCLAGDDRLMPYREIEPALKNLLQRFGPPRKRLDPEDPFWRLRNDGVWEIPGAEEFSPRRGGKAPVPDFRRLDAHGGFPPDIFAALREDGALAASVVRPIVEAHFPVLLREDVLRAVGLGPDMLPSEEAEGSERYTLTRRRARDRAFAGNVLAAYGHRCAVCDFSLILEDQPLALEAAHIKWHQARGPDRISNGLALCAVHHRLFDYGAFTLTPEHRVVAAPGLKGDSVHEALGRHEGREARPPVRDENMPDLRFLRWHHREVFRAPERVETPA